jgi:hypothetical protein
MLITGFIARAGIALAMATTGSVLGQQAPFPAPAPLATSPSVPSAPRSLPLRGPLAPHSNVLVNPYPHIGGVRAPFGSIGAPRMRLPAGFRPPR